MQTSQSVNDPSNLRIHRPRLPKSYTDAQLAYLRNHLPEFERKSQGAIRGDAKKFALERAQGFIEQFGLPEDFEGVEESEPRFKEQIYNWFKNTVGRTRRKLEGRPRSVKKTAEKGGFKFFVPRSPINRPDASILAGQASWTTDLNSPTIIPYSQTGNGSTIASGSESAAPVPYGGVQPSGSMPPVPGGSNNNLSLNLNVGTLRDAFLTPAIEPSTLSSMIQTFAISHPSHIPLTTVVHALFDAITTAIHQSPSSAASDDPGPCYTLLRRFLDACSYFPATISHAGVPGALAGPRALQMQLRKTSIWVPNPLPPLPPPQSTSMTDEMERIAADRQRRKDYIQWARVHAAALELGILGDSQQEYALNGMTFSEVMARDAVWEQDEVEWVAGICVLRAIIRTGLRGDARRKEEYEGLLRTYEGRWKEIKDETRQALVTEVLLGAKDDLLRFEGQQSMMG